MRDYGRVYSKFWSSDDIRELTEDGRLLALYLLTCAHGTLAGVCHLPLGYVAEDVQWTFERVAKGFDELLVKGFAKRCERTKWVWVCKYLTWNPPENPNQLKAARKIACNLPEKCGFRTEFQHAFKQHNAAGRIPEQKSLGTLAQPLPTQDQDQDQYQEQEQEQEGSQTPTRAGESGNGNPNLNGHGPPPEESATWRAIQAAYPRRSGSQRWADALTEYADQLRLGYTEVQMLEGTQRYAAYCKTEGIEGQVTVQAARTFFGANRGFLDPWEPGRRLSTAERWMREQEAKDAQH